MFMDLSVARHPSYKKMLDLTKISIMIKSSVTGYNSPREIK